MTFWDEFSREEQRVMITGIEEGWLNGIIDDYLARPERGGAIWIKDADAESVRAVIPQFAAIVRDLVERDLIEIREPTDGDWERASSIMGAPLEDVLADQKTWIWSEDGDNRMVMVLTTERADALMGRFAGDGQTGHER